jgi:tRNA A-37 threonylcarbamoyl transferase component Bud32
VTDPRELTSAGVRWRLAPAALGPADVDRLIGPSGLRLQEWLADGSACPVKQAPHRTLFRVVLPGLDFHVKCYPAARGGWLRRRAGRPAARREFERTLALARRGVPVPQPLAVGESLGTGPREGFLITRTLADAAPLDAFLQAAADIPPALRQALARALGRLLARLHDAGLEHDDLHPGNVLLRLRPGAGPELFLVDLLQARLGPPLGWRAARDNLVVLNRWFHLRCDRTDRSRFWHAYRDARAGGIPDDPLGELPRELERFTLRSNLRFWHAHDRRCLGGNRHFRRFRQGDCTGHAVADLDDATLASFLADPDAPFAAPGARVLKDGGDSRVVGLELPGPDGPRAVVYKWFPLRRALDPLAALARPTQALRSYVLGHALRLRCLPTPRPLAVWHRRRAGLCREGYLLTEKVPDALDLRAFVEQIPAEARSARLRRLIDHLARLLARLHERHLSHRDLKAANLLVSPAPAVLTGRGGIAPLGPETPDEPDGDQIWLIDLVGVRRLRQVSWRRRVLDLTRLHASFHRHPGVSRADKLRFLRAYLAWGLRGRPGWKRWWRAIAAATRAKVRRNRRAGRPLG